VGGLALFVSVKLINGEGSEENNKLLTIYNTLTNQKDVFKPITPKKINMYVCGMTVYDYCHLGHARVMVAFDVIVRYLRFAGYDVTYVRNITDVDDKIIKRAAENNETCDALTERFIKAMHEDEAALSVIRPDIEPRATQHIGHIVDMVNTLIDKGFAYKASNNDVYFRVNKFADYGKLMNQNLEELQSGARVDVEEAKESPLDFVLWKAAKPNEISWPSDFGAGRPGWHIECSAMSTQCLGNHFDIHGGGPDLKFPHHENEIAQSECATGEKFVNYWMHAGAVRVNNEKMSKSLGNFFTIREILAKYPAEVVRYLLTSSHYRSQIDYSEDSLKEARVALDRFYNALRGVDLNSEVTSLVDADYEKRFVESMNDDFNTREALSVLFDMVRELNSIKEADKTKAQQIAQLLRKLGGVLGLLQNDPETYLKGSVDVDAAKVEELIAKRNLARKHKDFTTADDVRAELTAMGIAIEDTREGTLWKRIS
jgi:cysteinyl-tRNA synthetase